MTQKEVKGLKKLRSAHQGKKPMFNCDNCHCMRYSNCKCTRKKSKS